MQVSRSRSILSSLLSAGFLAATPVPAAELVSLNQSGTDSANDLSAPFQVSASGRYVVFSSRASDFGPTDTNNDFDLYLRDRQTGVTRLISANAAGTDSGNGFSFNASFSADERFVVFTSQASNLTALPDTNGGRDVFLWSVQTGQTTLISVNASGTAAGNRPVSGRPPVVSGNASRVAFASYADDLGPTDSNGTLDVYVRDVAAGTTQLASVNAAGSDSGDNGITDQSSLAISEDGRIVAFASESHDLVPLPAGGPDIFARDLVTGTTTLVSVNASGTGGGNGPSIGVRLSADGRFIGFLSAATDLTTIPDSNGDLDGFVRDLQQPVATLVSVNATGSATANGRTLEVVPTADGSSVVFTTFAADLGPADGNSHEDIYLRELQTGAVQLVSVNAAASGGGDGRSLVPFPSADGRVVLFSSYASDLVATDTNATADVFLRDTQTATTRLLSSNAAGTDSGNGGSTAGIPEISTLTPDGRTAVFTSEATDLVATDTNGAADAFIVELPAEPPTRPALYLTPALTVLADGRAIQDEDVVRYSPDEDDFELYFDGSDVGLTLAKIDSLELLEDGDLLLSFAGATLVPGVGFVQSDDIVRFTPSSTGANTAGAFSLFFDASDHGISGLLRNLDAIAYDGALQFSPTLALSVDGIRVQNEDVVELDLATGDARLLFDGSAFGLSFANVDGVDVLADGSLVLSFDLLVHVPGLGVVEDEDLVRFVPATPGSATAGSFSLYLEGDRTGLFGLFTDINALAIEP